MARQLQKGVLYFLALEDPAGGAVPPFYKIGVTTDTVDKRIRQLQTGNPFRIVPHRTLVLEGAEFVERFFEIPEKKGVPFVRRCPPCESQRQYIRLEIHCRFPVDVFYQSGFGFHMGRPDFVPRDFQNIP